MTDGQRNLNSLRIGLLLRSDHAHHRQIAMGAVEYSRSNNDVKIIGERAQPLISWERLDEFEGDGLVAIAESNEALEQLKNSNIPFVLAGSRLLNEDVTVVASDNAEIGAQAAQHLVSCGLKNFLFVGSRTWDDERLRFEGFRDTLLEAGFNCDVADQEAVHQSLDEKNGMHSNRIQTLQALLVDAKYPLGVFCPNSLTARATLNAADAAGIVIPDQLALLAVNSDPILCETTDPPLSSVVQNSKSIGFLAAQTLVDQVAGKTVTSTMVAPKRIAVRRSSDMLMVGDESVEKALRFIRDNAHRVLEIAEIATHVGVSRRTLEVRFRDTLESSPHQELLRMRLKLAKSLLVESEMSVTQIALSSGFGSSQVFSTVFKKQIGMTPTQYRGQK